MSDGDISFVRCCFGVYRASFPSLFILFGSGAMIYGGTGHMFRRSHKRGSLPSPFCVTYKTYALHLRMSVVVFEGLSSLLGYMIGCLRSLRTPRIY